AITNNNAPGTAASAEETAARRAAHLAVAAPPLFTLTGVVLAIFNIPGLGILPWTLGWIAIFGTLSFLHRHGASTSFIALASSPALLVAHVISASFIIVFFLALHLANHLAVDTRCSQGGHERASFLVPCIVVSAPAGSRRTLPGVFWSGAAPSPDDLLHRCLWHLTNHGRRLSRRFPSLAPNGSLHPCALERRHRHKLGLGGRQSYWIV